MEDRQAVEIEFNSGVTVLSIDNNYSGRGMYRKTTTALIVESFKDVQKVMESHKIKYDNIGLNYVIY